MLIDKDVAAERRSQFPDGARVRAVNFVLDGGLRLWHDQADTSIVRVVRVIRFQPGPDHFTELMRGTLQECEAKHPDAVWSINDNETVPPGTAGTVTSVDDGGTVHVKWDNGRTIGVTPEDTIERI